MAWSRESRHKRGYGAAWDRVRKQALRRDNHLCQPCLSRGHITAAEAVDHITPKARGGTDDLSNLQSICGDCHNDKTATEAAEAQGRDIRPRVRFDRAGRVVW